ncbi:MAG: hypothetical protein IT363_04340 [Methanoregulaceae archaeon]|nr:hypothetical protein [Methanoregulaceae archaeon]
MKGIGLGIVVGVLAGCQSGSKSVAIEPIKLKNEAAIADVYVNDDQALKSWTLDGQRLDSYRSTALDEVTAEERTVLPNPDGFRSIRVELQLPHDSDMPSVAFKEDGVHLPATATLLIDGHRWVAWYAKPFKGTKEVDLSVGVSTAPWEVVGAYRWSDKKAEHVSGQEFKPKLTTQGAEGNESVLLSPASPSESTSLAFRYVLKDKKGDPLMSAGSADREGTRTYWFRGGLGNVATIELQSRPYEWIDLGRVNVAGN